MKFNLPITVCLFFTCSALIAQIEDVSNDRFTLDSQDSNFVDLNPNRMEVNPSGIIPYAELEEGVTLTYDIYFQNLLNETVDELTIIDTLSGHVDFSSFQMVSTTHDYEIYPIPPSIMVWKFYNINLLDSLIGQEKSRGHIQFTVDIADGANMGDSVINGAHLIFDSDIHLWTNKVWNAFDLPIGVNDESNAENVKVYPNPSSDMVFVDLRNVKQHVNAVKIYDVEGKLWKELTAQNAISGILSINVSEWPKGLYSVQIISEDSRHLQQLVIE